MNRKKLNRDFVQVLHAIVCPLTRGMLSRKKSALLGDFGIL